MGGAAATTNPTFYTSYAVADVNDCFRTIANTSGSLSGTTPVTLVAAPTPTDVRHDTRDVTIFNVDTQANTITVRVDVGGSKFPVWTGSVPAGGSVRLENSSGRWTVYNSSGLVVTTTVGSTPTFEVLVQAFTYLSSLPLDFGALTAGDIIVNSEVEISTVFDDGTSIVTLGLSTATGSILNSGEINPLVLGNYQDTSNHDISGADAVRLQIVPGTSTQGAGRAIVTIRRA